MNQLIYIYFSYLLKTGLISASLTESEIIDVPIELFKFPIIKSENILVISNGKNVIFWAAFEKYKALILFKILLLATEINLHLQSDFIILNRFSKVSMAMVTASESNCLISGRLISNRF